MAKGVKKIGYISGKIDSKLTTATTIVVPPNEWVVIGVKDWEAGTTETEKKNAVTWIWQTPSRKVISKINAVNIKVHIIEALCGVYPYYIEASLSGKTDKRPIGLHVIGHCHPKITKTQWSTVPKGGAISSAVAYGSTVYLDIKTEGLNGYKSLAVEVYNKDLKKPIATLQSQKVVDGVTVVEVKTISWLLKNATESFYVKIKHPSTGAYVHDGANKVDLASFLQINNVFAPTPPLFPTSITPLKQGAPNVNATKHTPCQYTAIELTNDKGEIIQLYKEDNTKPTPAIIYTGVIVGDKKKKFTIEVDKKSSIAQCPLTGTSKHTKQLAVGKNLPSNVTIINQKPTKIDFEAWFDYSLFDNSEIALKYIWPTSNVFGAEINTIPFKATTCRPNHNIDLKIYPDIRWELAFMFALKNPMAYTYSAGKDNKDNDSAKRDLIYAEAHKKAYASGNDRNKLRQGKDLDVDFFLTLKGKFNKVSDAVPARYNNEFEHGKKWAKKISDFLDVLMKLKKLAQNAKDKAGGAARNPKSSLGGLVKDNPFSFEIMSPKVGGVLQWEAEQIKTGQHIGEICNTGTLKLVADPLIGAEFTINMLAVASKMNPAVYTIKKGVDIGLDAMGGYMKLDLKFFGALNITIEALKINSLERFKRTDKPAKIDGKMGIELIFEIKAKGEVSAFGYEVELSFAADARASAYFGGTALIEADSGGVYADLIGKFSGLLFSAKFEIKIGKYTRKATINNEPVLPSETYKLGKIYLT
jgi:hypothetical protein